MNEFDRARAGLGVPAHVREFKWGSLRARRTSHKTSSSPLWLRSVTTGFVKRQRAAGRLLEASLTAGSHSGPLCFFSKLPLEGIKKGILAARRPRRRQQSGNF